MEEVINKPEEQFQDVLEELVDYDKNSKAKSALIEEVCREASKQLTKPAASLNSSIYSSTSSASDSSTNSASSSSASSTLSSPSQSNQSNGQTKEPRTIEIIEHYDNLEMPKMEDLGKTARFLEHISNQYANTNITTNNITANDIGSSIYAVASHSDTDLSADNTSLANSWKTMSAKRDKRRRKPTEQPVLSQHIPGHKGEQEVDWLVKFIESGPGAANSTNNISTKKSTTNKNSKPQPKRQAAQHIDLNRENQQRKPISDSISSKSASTQSRPLLPQNKPTSSGNLIANMPQAQRIDQRKVQSTPDTFQQSQPSKQILSSQEPLGERVSERKESSQKPAVSQARRNSEQKQEKSEHDEAAVTFADHIGVSDEDNVDQRYTFGFFEEQRQHINQVKSSKSPLKHNEKSVNINSKVGQKHKMRYQKASLDSEQKRYKCNDNIDANSFNYHQILEFISNSWASTAKSDRPILKHMDA